MKLVSRYSPGSKRLQDDPSAPFLTDRPWLFLLRHGRIQGHETRRFIGRTDIPLDETGRGQALFWKKIFGRARFEKIYCSSLARCRDTAALACPEEKIQTDARLNEIDLGTWEGKSFAHVKKNMPDLFQERGEKIDRFRPPSGESFTDLFNRVSPFFSALHRDSARPILVVTHSGVIRVMLCHYLGMEPAQLLEIRPGYGELFLLGS